MFIPSGATFGDLESQIALRAPLSSVVGFKNLLVNPNFLINQRNYVSETNSTVTNQYAHDRWRIPTIGQNVTFTFTNNVTTVTAPSGGYEQVIEHINVQSGDYKISHEGTANISVAESTDNITYTTLTINTNGTYTLTGGKYVRVRFSSGTVIKPQVELGSVRTPFENRPIGLELSLCKRYYNVVNESPRVEGSAAYSGAAITYSYYYPVKMRTIPTAINFYWVNGFNATPGTTSVAENLVHAELLAVNTGNRFSAYYSMYALSAEL